MSFTEDATLACLNALRSRPWPPTSGELDLLRRAAEVADAQAVEAEADRASGATTPGYPRVA